MKNLTKNYNPMKNLMKFTVIILTFTAFVACNNDDDMPMAQ